MFQDIHLDSINLRDEHSETEQAYYPGKPSFETFHSAFMLNTVIADEHSDTRC